MKPTVGLVYDLKDDYIARGFSEDEAAEFDSLETVEALREALNELGYAPRLIGCGLDLAARLAAGESWDLVFNIAEGLSGRSREAQVPALLELYGLPYTFSDPLVCALTLDKAFAKRVVQSAGFRTPQFHVASRQEDLAGMTLPYPVFAKPAAEGTSKGIDASSRAEDAYELEKVVRRLLTRYGQPVLIEEYLPGREFTTGILGTGQQSRVLGTMEVRVRPDAPDADYSYKVKQEWRSWVEYRPLGQGQLADEVEWLALEVYRLLGIRDAGRVDIRLDESGRPSFMEVNPIPGLHPVNSDLPMIAGQQGLPYVKLIGEIVYGALRRAGRTFSEV